VAASQRSATPERQQQQPTANERLLAASALPVAATPERQQPTANERLLAASKSKSTT